MFYRDQSTNSRSGNKVEIVKKTPAIAESSSSVEKYQGENIYKKAV